MSTYGSPRTRWISDVIMFLLITSVAIKLGYVLGFLHSVFVTALPVLDNWVFGFSSIRWMSLLFSCNIRIQITRPIIFIRNRRRWSR